MVNIYDASFGGVEAKPNNKAFTQPGNVITLPVTLTSFTAYQKGNVVEIVWVTAQETNNSHFIVQRSTDGKTYQDVATITGGGNVNGTQHYRAEDESPFAGISYYRLVQVDYDGKSETFDPVAVNILTTWQVSTYPNPIQDGKEVTIIINSEESQYLALELVDINGQVYWNYSTEVSSGTNRLKLPNQAMPKAGMYLLRITNRLNSQVVKLIKN
jgi:hypothetical protein